MNKQNKKPCPECGRGLYRPVPHPPLASLNFPSGTLCPFGKDEMDKPGGVDQQEPAVQKLINEVAELTEGMDSFAMDELEREVERDREEGRL